MEQKLIFLDIDGTILIPGEGIRQEVRDGLRLARKHGHRVFICTGRAHCMLPEELRDMELDGIIASAGSDIWIHGQNAYRTALEPELLEKACRTLEDLDGVYMLEGYDRIYVSEKGERLLRGMDPIPNENPELYRWREFFNRRSDVESVKTWDSGKIPIPKVAFMLWEKERVEQIYKALEEDFYIAFFQQDSDASYYNGELISRSANKGTAIRRTAELLKQDIQNTIAFGDSMNDYQMIEHAACGVVMGNGDEKLKAIADRICEPVEEDGVIRELERMHII
ncbi:MAG: HAD family phosphatase [Clostridiales bacterium]|nr:HAD family phosphatase [Clostridiales bacterium]